MLTSVHSTVKIEIYNMGLTSETCFGITKYTADRIICNSSSDKYEIMDSNFIDSLFCFMDSLEEENNVNPDIRTVMRIYDDSYLHETIYFNSEYIIRGDCIYIMRDEILSMLYDKLGNLD